MTVVTPALTAAVTGASGVLGRMLVRHLMDQGWSVRTLERRATTGSSAVTRVVGHMLDEDAVHRTVEGADVVFHLAWARTGPTADALSRDNLEGTRLVARAAQTAGACRFVHFGSIAVYGDTSGRTADEDAEATPTTPYGRSKLDSESVVFDEAPGAVVLRLAAVYGPRVHGNYLRLATLCARGMRLVGCSRRTLVHEDDLMSAALVAARHDAAHGRVFNVTDGSSHTLTSITASMQAALGGRPALALPVGPARALSRLANRMPAVLRPLVEDNAADGRRFQVDLGFMPGVSLRSGWQKTIGAWRQQGLL